MNARLMLGVKWSSRPLLTARRVLTVSVRPRSGHVLSDCCVVYSKSTDIFVNLALEDWLYRSVNVNDVCGGGGGGAVLLMWRNGPAVVVGRHQNPWREAYVSRCMAQDVCVVRRNSGGGTVYHDMNNLNISFICHKRLYNRLNNLLFVQNVLFNKFNIDLEITRRDDLVLARSGHKISGTASKVGAHNSYHHLTLLIDADLNQMKQLIRKESPLMTSKATESIPSKTTNLKSVNKDLHLEDVVKEMAIQFCRDQGRDTSSAYMELMADHKTFVGIKDIENTFRSWQWIYGKTPRFTITKEFLWKDNAFYVEIQVFHGFIEKLSLTQFQTNINLDGIPFTKLCVTNRLNQCLSQTQHNHSFDHFLSHCIIECLEQTL